MNRKIKEYLQSQLHDNEIEVIENLSLPKLGHLYLYNNKLSSVPSFDQMPFLLDIRLGNNQLTACSRYSVGRRGGARSLISIVRYYATTLPWVDQNEFEAESRND